MDDISYTKEVNYAEMSDEDLFTKAVRTLPIDPLLEEILFRWEQTF